MTWSWDAVKFRWHELEMLWSWDAVKFTWHEVEMLWSLDYMKLRCCEVDMTWRRDAVKFRWHEVEMLWSWDGVKVGILQSWEGVKCGLCELEMMWSGDFKFIRNFGGSAWDVLLSYTFRKSDFWLLQPVPVHCRTGQVCLKIGNPILSHG